MTEQQWKLIFDALDSVQDAGPNGEGWQTTELQDAIQALRDLKGGE